MNKELVKEFEKYFDSYEWREFIWKLKKLK